MILRPILVDKVLRLQKTQLRRPLKPYSEPANPWIVTKGGQRRRRPVPRTIELDGVRYLAPLVVGQVIPIQKGQGRAASTHVQVVAIRRERLGEISLRDVNAEGHRTTSEFKCDWVRTHDREHADGRDGELVERFDVVHADRLAWVATFTVCEQPTRYLARPTTGGDYTSSPSQSIDVDEQQHGTRLVSVPVAAVDDDFLERVVRDARDREPARPIKRAPLPPPTDAERDALADQLRVRYHGWEPEDITADDPRFGTPGDIREARRRMGLRGTDGLDPIPADEAEGVLSFMQMRGASLREIALAMDWSLSKTRWEMAKRVGEGKVEQLPVWLREKPDDDERMAA